jgi:ribosomal protein S18 acetylase RimI-like enzyme
MTTIRIRRATREDLPALVALQRACFGTREAFNRRLLRDLIDGPRSLCRVAEIDGAVAGWCVGRVRRHPRCWSGRIYDLAVDPAYRGHRLGIRLARRMLAELLRFGVRRIYLEVRADNLPAITLYEKLGFHHARALPHYYGRHQHGVSMRLMFEKAPPRGRGGHGK